MLLGDPALNIRTRAPAPADTFDVAVGTSDIRTAWGSYAHSAGTIEVTVHNAWKTDVYDLEVELWRGEPGSEGSSLFGTEVIDTLRAYGPDVVTFSVSGLEGNVRLYVVLDPDDLIAERAEDNNIAFRDFLALPYEGAYPTRPQFNGAERSVTIADLASAPGKEILVSGFTSTDRVLQCYAVGDTQAVWTYGTGSVLAHIKNQPVAGHLYKSASSYVAVEHGSSVRILNGQSGAVVKTRLVGDTRPVVNNWEAKWLLSDLGPDDPEMEFVTLRYIDGAFGDSLQVRAFSPGDTILFTHSVDVGLSVGAATAAIGDLDMDGSKEIVILQAHANTGPGSPAAGNELTVLSYGTGGLTQKWQKDLAEGTITDPTIVLIDKGGDGTLSVLCNGAYPGPILRLYSASGSLEWTLSDLAFGYPVHFAAGDVDGDQTADVVVLDHQRVRLVSSANGSVLDTRTTPGDPVAPPLLIDLDADGTLEIVVVFEEQDPNIHFYPPNEAPFWTHVVILDANLGLFQPEWTFRTRRSASSSCLPAVDDIDDDGKFEMVYVSPDQYLHVFELGSAAGEAAWSQRFGNAQNTGLNEQPILGDGYVNPLSLYQKTRMLGHVVLDSTAAPSLYIGHGTEIRVDASVSDPFQLRAFGSVRMKGSATAPVVIHSDPPASGAATWGGLYLDNRFARATKPDTLSFVHLSDASTGIEVHSPLHVTSSAISNLFEAGIVSDDTLSVKSSDVLASSEVGIELLAGGHGWISDSHVEGAGTGVLAAQGSPVTIRNSTISNVVAAGVVAGDTLWFDRSSISTSSGLGIKLASGAVGRIRKSTVSNTDSTAVLCDSCAYHTTVDSTSVRSAGGDGLRIIGSATWQGTSGIAIDSCTVEDNTGAGIRFEGAHGTVSRCRVEGNGAGVVAGNASNASAIENTVIAGGATGVEHHSPVRITGSRISNVASVAVVSSDTLWFESSEVDVSAGQGIYLGSGAVGRISDSSVAGTDFSAIVCDTCGTRTTIRRTTIDSAGLHGIHVVMSADVLVDSCVVVNSASAGVRFEWADGTVSKSRLDGNGGGVVCFESSSPVIRECSMDGNTGGVAAVYDSYPVVGYGTSGGLNCITNSTGYHVTNLNSPGTIFARHDYWGAVCCKANKFFGNVSCDSCETSSACDAAAAPGSFVVVGAEVEARADSVAAQDEAGPALPKALDLVNAAPNPFNPSVRIRYAVPAGGARVRLAVYNVRGQRVAILEDGPIPAGYHEAIWHGRTSRGAPAASGVYFVQMRAGDFRKVMRIVLLK